MFISILLIAFAVVSGAEGSDFTSIVKNTPNAWPWFLLLCINILAWKKPKLAGVLVAVFGLYSIYYFNFTGSRFYPIVFFVTVLITSLGLSLILLKKKSEV